MIPTRLVFPRGATWRLDDRPCLSLKAVLALVVFLLASLTGCEERAEMWQQAVSLEGPEVAGEHLVWLDRTAAGLIVLDAAAEAPARRLSLAPRPRDMAILGNKVLVTGGSGNEPRVEVFDVGEEWDEPLSLDPGGEAFDRIWAPSKGGHAVLTYSMDADGHAGLAARNLNRVAVLDLEKAPPVIETVLLKTDSLAPREVVFSPDGGLAAIMLEASIVLLDLREPSRIVRVPLRLPGGQRLLPMQALFSPGADYLYVRAGGTADLLVIEILDGETLSASVNFLYSPGAESLSYIKVPQGEGFEHYVAAVFQRAADSVAALLHASGDATVSRQVTVSQRATRLLDMGDGSMIIHGVPAGAGFSRWVAGWEPLSSRVDERELQGTYFHEPVVTGGHAFFRHQQGAVAGAPSTAALTGVAVDTGGTWLRVRPSAMLLLGNSTAAAGGGAETYFVSVDVDRKDSGAAPTLTGQMTGKTGAIVAVSGSDLDMIGITLDDPVAQMGIIGDYLYAVHDRLLGDVTLVPMNDLSREAARRHDGLLLTGVLDLGEEQ